MRITNDADLYYGENHLRALKVVYAWNDMLVYQYRELTGDEAGT